MSASLLIVLSAGLLGFVAGLVRPTIGVALLAGLVCVTSSLPWQLGMANLSFPFAFVLGLLVGWLFTVAREARAGGKPLSSLPPAASWRLNAALWLTVGFALVSSVLALARARPWFVGPVVERMPGAVASLFVFNPAGIAGMLQAAIIFVAGPLLFVMVLQLFRSPAEVSLLQRALVCGGVIAALSPVVQAALLDPWVRPDEGVRRGFGLVGFFQDPHGYAAYLVLTGFLAIGLAVEGLRDGRVRRAAAYAGLFLGTFVVLLYTSSRGGLVAWVLALTVFCLGLVTTRMSAGRRHKAIVLAAGVVCGLAASAYLATLESVRAVLHPFLSRFGTSLMWLPLRPDSDPLAFLQARVDLWSRAVEVVAARPLWGAGPDGFSALQLAAGSALEHAHNYYLQTAADYGLPTLLGLLACYAISASLAARGALNDEASSRRYVLLGVLAAQVGVLAFSLISHPFLLIEVQATYWVLSAFAVVVAPSR